jgi:hypothetical protein
MDPDSPELDNALIQYESTISRALAAPSNAQTTDNLTKPQRRTLTKMGVDAKTGGGNILYLSADKDTAFVAVTLEQCETMWHSHTASNT